MEVQTITLDKMFTAQLWKAVISLCKGIVEDAASELLDMVKQYYGLAMFNMKQYSISSDLLKDLYQKTHKENILLFSILAEMKNINYSWQDGHYEHRDRLVELIGQLDSLKENKQYKNNNNLIAILYLETAYNLGINEKKYLENAVERYQGFPDEIKNDATIKYLYALCTELNGSPEKAEKIYAELDWINDINVACRYLICKLVRNENAGAIELYMNINRTVIDTKIRSLYLTALFYEGKEKYENTLKDFLHDVQDNLESIIDIALGIHEKQHLQKYIIPLIREEIHKRADNLSSMQKMKLLSILSHAEEIGYVLEVLKIIREIGTLSHYIIMKIYNATFAISNRGFSSQDKTLVKSEQLEASDQIADIFLEANVSRREFLQIKYLCAGAKEKRFSMLKYAKELFEITNGEDMARSIIAMLFERNETDFNAYAPYIAVLSNSTKPSYCISIASAMLRLGKTEEADLYAYRALYYLNDVEDYNIYKSYFAYYYQNLNRYHDGNELKRVKGNTVVTLVESIVIEGQEPKSLVVCLDSESEFTDSNNRSMNVSHISAGSTLYLKILGSGLNQVLKIEDVYYRINSIRTRTDYAVGFIFGKVNEHPEKFDETVIIDVSEKPEEIVKKIKEITDRTKHSKELINYYHFKGNETGLPIDAFINGDYERYIDALTMLLYAKDRKRLI